MPSYIPSRPLQVLYTFNRAFDIYGDMCSCHPNAVLNTFWYLRPSVSPNQQFPSWVLSACFILREVHHQMSSFHLPMALLLGIHPIPLYTMPVSLFLNSNHLMSIPNALSEKSFKPQLHHLNLAVYFEFSGIIFSAVQMHNMTFQMHNIKVKYITWTFRSTTWSLDAWSEISDA